MLKKFLICVICSLICVICVYAQESISITTYYPSPYGSYRELTSHRMKIGTTYSGGGTSVDDNNLIVEGNVGIGTASPSAKLHIGDGTSASGIIIDDNATSGVSPTITQAAANAVFGGATSNADAWHTHSGIGIKKVQRGGLSLSPGDQSGTAAISAVNVSKSFLTVNSTGWGAATAHVTAYLLDSTTIQFWRYDSGSGASVRWEVIEFN